MFEEIKQNFDKVISYSQSIPNPKTEKLFELWELNKRPFRQMFGGLIYETEEKVSFEISEKEKTNRIMEFASTVDFRWHYPELSDFIVSQKEGFFNNLTIADFSAPEGGIITKGTKIVKAFKHFVKDERSLIDIQNAASRIIQENKIEGKLCFSVHPLDYISSSENNHNWRSCHALDGEYRAGTLSYMMDTSTIVCYIKSDEDERLPNFPEDVKWNSKKWRTLLHISEDKKMVIAGRSYPFESAAGLNLVRDNLINLMKLFLGDNPYKTWTTWQTVISDSIYLADGEILRLHSTYLPVGQSLMPIKEVVKTPQGSKHYNDLFYSSCYTPKYMMWGYSYDGWDCAPSSFELLTDSDTKFIVGSFTYCLRCGQAECMDAADTMLCVDCELEYGVSNNEAFVQCYCCGRRILDDDAWLVQGELVCDTCYNREVTRCDNCNDLIFTADVQYHEADSEYLCLSCYYDKTHD